VLSKRLFHEKIGFKDCAWQEGYGAFTISQSHIPRTIRHVQNQRQHHAKATFEVEYRQFLPIHGISR
jgi:hypothetical protein